MADKLSGDPKVSKDFEEFLKACPEVEDPANQTTIRVVGQVMRSKAAGMFALQATDGSIHDVPRAAVEEFTTMPGSGASGRMAELALNREKLGEDLVNTLSAIKIPIEKPVLDTLKEVGGPDTLKEQPFDTLKEIGGSDTLKEQPFDTLKEIGGGGDTLKEQPFDTLKEVGGGDTLKEQPFDTVKEMGGGDTFKEIGGGDGTGIADTLVEGIPGQPGGGQIQPTDFQANARMAAQPGQFGATAQLTLKEVINDGTIKEQPFDTLKEVGGSDTLKELIDDTLKELTQDTLKEIGKDPIDEGTGIADTLVEGIPGMPGGELVQPELQLMQARAAGGMAAQPAQQAFKGIPQDLTIKEVVQDHTLKEMINDQKHFKEIVKEVAIEGTGVADTLVEGRPDFGSIFTNPAANPAGGTAAGVPFVLATPHQASQGAVAQQMLAAQAMMGRIGF